MSTALLALIALVQGAFLMMLLVLVGVGRWLGVYRGRRRCKQRERVGHAAQNWLAGGASSKALRRTVDSGSFAAAAEFLTTFGARRGGDEWERLAAEIQQTSWFRTLCRHASSPFWWRRLGAARLLAKLASSDQTAIALALLADPRPPVRVAAAEIVARVPSRELMEELYEFASSTGAVVRGHLLELLAKNRAVLEEMLIERLASDRDRASFTTALELAGQIGVPSLLPVILPYAEAEDLEVRIATARALSSFPHPRSGAALMKLLGDAHWEARAVAASSLGAIGAIEAIDTLRGALEDPSWWVRLRGAVSLRVLGPVGIQVLESVGPEADSYAYDMATYVLRLSDSAVLEFVTRSISSDAAAAADRAA
jgi:hypothetical protein